MVQCRSLLTYWSLHGASATLVRHRCTQFAVQQHGLGRYADPDEATTGMLEAMCARRRWNPLHLVGLTRPVQLNHVVLVLVSENRHALAVFAGHFQGYRTRRCHQTQQNNHCAWYRATHETSREQGLPTSGHPPLPALTAHFVSLFAEPLRHSDSRRGHAVLICADSVLIQQP